MNNIAALIDKEDKIIYVPLTGDIHAQMHSVQSYGERFLPEVLVLSSAPGEIELNATWTWKFILDPGLYDIDESLAEIPMYKDQQH